MRNNCEKKGHLNRKQLPSIIGTLTIATALFFGGPQTVHAQDPGGCGEDYVTVLLQEGTGGNKNMCYEAGWPPGDALVSCASLVHVMPGVDLDANDDGFIDIGTPICVPKPNLSDPVGDFSSGSNDGIATSVPTEVSQSAVTSGLAATPARVPVPGANLESSSVIEASILVGIPVAAAIIGLSIVAVAVIDRMKKAGGGSVPFVSGHVDSGGNRVGRDRVGGSSWIKASKKVSASLGCKMIEQGGRSNLRGINPFDEGTEEGPFYRIGPDGQLYGESRLGCLADTEITVKLITGGFVVHGGPGRGHGTIDHEGKTVSTSTGSYERVNPAHVRNHQAPQGADRRIQIVHKHIK